MGIFQSMEKSMAMSDASWARHANPWSVWTRIPILPALALAIWARDWIGWWALVPIALVVVWAFINPRAFPPPATLDHWASRGVLGERAFLAHKTTPIADHHHRWGIGLSIAAGLGLLPLVYGLWVFDGWAVVSGLSLSVGAKLWFVDRMAWLHQDMALAQSDQ